MASPPSGSTLPSTGSPVVPERLWFHHLPRAELIDRYATGSSQLERRLLDLNDAQLDTYFRPEAQIGRWSCRVLVGHVADAELVQAHRMRRTVAEHKPVLALWDENAFVDEGLYAGEHGGRDRPVAGHVALIHTVRLWTSDWLRTLDNEAWARSCLHPEKGELTVHALVANTTWHLEHHAGYLSRKLAVLLGPPSA